MEFFSLKCPQCDAALEVTDEYDLYSCPYCGSEFILDGRSDTAARLKEQQIDIEFGKYKLEHESKEKDKEFVRELKRGWYSRITESIPLLIAGGLIFLVLVGFVILDLIDNHKNAVLEKRVSEIYVLLDEKRYDEASKLADSLVFDGNSYEYKSKWETVKTNTIQEINKVKASNEGVVDVKINLSSKALRKMNYEDVIQYLNKLGFFNISAIESSKKRLLIHSIGEIDTISINGITSFKAEDVFPVNAMIAISYYGI